MAGVEENSAGMVRRCASCAMHGMTWEGAASRASSPGHCCKNFERNGWLKRSRRGGEGPTGVRSRT